MRVNTRELVSDSCQSSRQSDRKKGIISTIALSLNSHESFIVSELLLNEFKDVTKHGIVWRDGLIFQTASQSNESNAMM